MAKPIYGVDGNLLAEDPSIQKAVPREGEAPLIRSPSWLHVRRRTGADGGWRD